MNIKKLIAMFVLISFLSVPNALAEERNTKYQDVFYPNGMPVKDSMYGKGPTEYELYDELPIPDTNLIVVAYSEKVLGHAGDTLYEVFISILQSNNDVLSIKYLNEITNYLTLSAGYEPGYFEDMGASLDYFNISTDVKAVHLALSNSLSGSGAITSSSDVFFLIRDDTLVPVLELLGNSGGGRSGGYLSFVYVFMYLADTDLDGNMDIITQDHKYNNDVPEDDPIISDLSPNLNVYKYNSEDEKYELSGQITSLPTDAVSLNPGSAPDVEALTKEGCCP